MNNRPVLLPAVTLLAALLCISAIIPAVDASRLNDAIEAGDQAFKDDDMATALTQYQMAVDLDPNSTTAWYRIGLVLEWTGEYDHAVSAFDQAHTINPVYFTEDLLSNKGVALLKLGRYQEALTAFDQAIASNPNKIDAGVHNNRGLALLALGNQKEAMRAFDRAIAVDSYAYDAWNNEGVLLAQQGDFAEAQKRFSKIRDRSSMTSSSNIWWDKPTFFLVDQGNVYMLQQDYPAAIETFRLVVTDHPDKYDAHIGLGHAYLVTGNLTGAREEALVAEEKWQLVAPDFREIARTGHFTYHARMYYNVLTDVVTPSRITRTIQYLAFPVADSRLRGTQELLNVVNAVTVPATQRTTPEIPQTTVSTPVPTNTRAPLPVLVTFLAVGSACVISRWRSRV